MQLLKRNKKERIMILMKKRQILIVALSLVVVIAAYLNWTYTEPVEKTVTVAGNRDDTKVYGEATLVDGETETEEAEAVSATTESEYFRSARINRDKARSDSLDILREIAESGNATEEEKNSAFGKMSDAAKNTETEANVENLLKAKGFEDVIVYITEEAVSITVKTEGLTYAESAQIQEIAISETGASPEKIKIIEIK